MRFSSNPPQKGPHKKFKDHVLHDMGEITKGISDMLWLKFQNSSSSCPQLICGLLAQMLVSRRPLVPRARQSKVSLIANCLREHVNLSCMRRLQSHTDMLQYEHYAPCFEELQLVCKQCRIRTMAKLFETVPKRDTYPGNWH